MALQPPGECQNLPPCPDERTTLVGLDTVSSLCSSGHTPNIMTGIVLRVMQEHFARPENLIYNGSTEGRQQLEQYIWSPDVTRQQISIEPVWKYDPRVIQQRPAVLIKRNKWQTQRAALNDGMTVNQSVDSDGKRGMVEGEYKTRAVLGSHTIFCVAKTAAEAELLGAEVFDYLTAFAPVMREDFKFHRLEVSEVEGVSIVDEHQEHYVVAVVLAYAIYMSWRLEAVAPWLKTFAVDFFAAK